MRRSWVGTWVGRGSLERLDDLLELSHRTHYSGQHHVLARGGIAADEGDRGRGFLSRFQELESSTPAILTTSQLLTTSDRQAEIPVQERSSRPSKPIGRELQSLRKLTSASVELLRAAWDERESTADAAEAEKRSLAELRGAAIKASASRLSTLFRQDSVVGLRR